MSNTVNNNFVEEFFTRLQNDHEYRAHVINNTKQAMIELHGINEKMVEGVNFETIEQNPDEITIMIPTKPEDYSPEKPEVAKQIAHQTVDFMYTDGTPGFLIPNEDLRWILLKMRQNWLKKENLQIF
jgi:hypothetical protein